MTLRTRRRPLASRLRPHVASELAGAERAWWAPSGRRRRTAELAQAVEHLAVHVGAGCGLGMAIDHIVRDGRGTQIDELAMVAGWIHDGQPVARALRRWVTAGGGDVAGRLAAAVTSAAATDELARRLAALADELQDRAYDERLAATQRGARIAWTASALGLVAAITAALP